MGDLQKTNKELEALMFSMYCISLISLTNDEAEKSFGESKKKLLRRFRKGAQIAFANASLLRTSSFMVLQAFILYIVSESLTVRDTSTNIDSYPCVHFLIHRLSGL